MHLKRLELHGYKSFAIRTEFVFNDGVTAIVGPNGSGKSNIADAIQWVLGEQSFSSLRAKKTEDMIFAGSASRLRMGMAEVSMTLDNSSTWLPIDFSEVTITRRAYRSGENEYLLNGARMRLRDINELLSKGGLGRGSYTVIGQGLIDSAISLRPEERRTLLEDAAGISIYQVKKADAMSKLKGTHENLTRVSDILHELGPRVKRLHDQANRASQFEEVQRKLAERLQTWYGYQWHQAQEKLAESRQTSERTQAELSIARESLQSSDVERAALRERIRAQRTELEEWQRQFSEKQRAQQGFAQRHAVASERLGLISQQNADLLREIEDLAGDEQTASNIQKQLGADVARLQAEYQAANTELIQTRLAMSRRDETLRRIRAAQAESQRNALALTQQVAETTQRSANARERLGAISAERAQTEQAVASLNAEMQALQERAAAMQLHLEELIVELAEHAVAMREAQEHAASLHSQVSSLGTESAEAHARARTAQVELESAHNRGVKELRAAARSLGLTSVGVLSELYRVAPEQDQRVRGALGHLADALVVPTWADAQRLSAALQTRQTIVVAGSFGSSGAEQPVSDSPYGMITCADDHRAMFKALLGPVHTDDEAAPRVNARGELIASHSIVTPDLAAPNFSALEQNAGTTGARATDLAGRLATARTDEAKAVQERETFNARRLELESERSRVKSDLDNTQRDLERRRSERDRVASGRNRFSSEAENLTRQLEDWQKALESLQTRQSAMEPLAHASQETTDEDVDLPHRLADQETKTALLRQELTARQQALAQSGERITTAGAQRKARIQRSETLQAEMQELQIETGELASQIDALSQQITPLLAQIKPASERLQADEAELLSQESQELAARERLYAAESAHSQALVDLQRRQDRQMTLHDQIEGDYEFVVLTTDLPMALALELGEERVLKLPRIAEIPDNMEQEIRSLKNKMRWIGNVNLEAPSEYALEKARQEFLTTQSNDLLRASESLQQLVSELDAVMQQKFSETFVAVAKAFKEYFTKLFGGGSAELVLSEPSNLGETGVEILAHPPGKRRQPLGLLSGGERALTAGALIFALLRSSPTPFCVLDEVDAALDEANIGRFRSTLREVARETQYIVVTHNRGTVEVARAVYGISMGADGASQMISLRLDGVDVPQTKAA